MRTLICLVRQLRKFYPRLSVVDVLIAACEELLAQNRELGLIPKAQREFAEALEKSTDELLEVEKQQAIINHILHEESDMSRLSDDEKAITLSEIKEAWEFTPNIGATSYWFEQTDDGTCGTISPEDVLEIGCQLESQIDAMRDFMATLYLDTMEGRDEAFEALDEKTKHLINEVWFERLEEDTEDETE